MSTGPWSRPVAPVRWAAITNLGCKVNQSEVDGVERLLRARGVEILADGVAVDLHLVNTCTVTATADEKSRKALRRARRASPRAAVIATGRSIQVDRAALRAVDPAAHLLANDEKDALLATVERFLGPPEAGAAMRRGPLEGPLPTLAGVEAVAPEAATIAVPGAAAPGAAAGDARIDRARGARG